MRVIFDVMLYMLVMVIVFVIVDDIIKSNNEVKPNQLICLKTDKIISRHNIILECWEATK